MLSTIDSIEIIIVKASRNRCSRWTYTAGHRSPEITANSTILRCLAPVAPAIFFMSFVHLLGFCRHCGFRFVAAILGIGKASSFRHLLADPSKVVLPSKLFLTRGMKNSLGHISQT